MEELINAKELIKSVIEGRVECAAIIGNLEEAVSLIDVILVNEVYTTESERKDFSKRFKEWKGIE